MPHRKPVIPGADRVLHHDVLFACDTRAQQRVWATTRRPPLYNCPLGDSEQPFVMCCRNLFDAYYREEVEALLARRAIEEGVR